MDPEQGLLVIVEDLAVKLFVLLVRAVLGGLGPERICVVAQNRTAADLQALLFGLCILVLVLFLCGLDDLDDDILGSALRLVDGLCHLGVMLGQIDLDRHEGAILLNDFLCAVIVRELQAVLGQMQSDGRADLFSVSVVHSEGAAAVTLPVHGRCAVLPGQGVDLYQLCNHECAVEAQTEMTDDLIIAGLVLVLLHESFRAGKCDIVDVFLDFVSSHSQTVVSDFDGLLLGVDFNVDPGLIAFRKLIITHHIQLFQLCDGVTAIGDQFPVKDIVVRIQPLLDDREHIFTVD